jgi:hypothetical protein
MRRKKLTGIDGRPWQTNQDDENKIEDQIEEKIDSDRQPFHGGKVVKGYSRIIVN